MISKRKNLNGFTIVELLVVIVVIAILAAIVIVSYNGVSKQARESTVKNDLQSLQTQIGIYHVESDVYPNGDLTSLSVLNEGSGAKYGTSNGVLYTGTTSQYCITVYSISNPDISYYIDSATGSIQSGVCAGQTIQAALLL